MASLIRGIGNGFIGTYNTIRLGCEQISETSLWQKTGGIGVRCIRYSASFYPESLKHPFILGCGTGAATTILIGAGLKLYDKNKRSSSV